MDIACVKRDMVEKDVIDVSMATMAIQIANLVIVAVLVHHRWVVTPLENVLALQILQERLVTSVVLDITNTQIAYVRFSIS